MAQNGGHITLQNSSIQTANQDSYGLWTFGANSAITVQNTTIGTTGDGATGVFSDQQSSVTTTGGSVTASGNNAVVVYTRGNFSATNTTLTADGDQSFGLYLINAGSIISTTATATLTGTTIVKNGGGGSGISIFDSTVLTMTGGSITTNQANTNAVNISAGTGQFSGVTINTSGASAHGITVGAGGTATFDDGTMTLSGANAVGLYAYTNAATTLVTINADNSTISTPNGIAMRARGIEANIGITGGSTVTGGAGGLLLVDTNTAIPGVGNLTADNSTLIGDVNVAGTAANVAAVTLQNKATLTGSINVDATSGGYADLSALSGSTFTGAATNARNIEVSGSSGSTVSTWNVTGDSTLTGTLTNGGVVAFANSGPFKTITTANYTGNGGQLHVNTALGGDNSATDKLIINGGAGTGSTTVSVTNKGGAGAQTTNGIQIIQATGGATTTAGAFNLANPVTAGLYQYQLFRGPLSGGTADDQNSWYLRSQAVGPGPNPVPLYRPEGAMYGAMASLGRELMRTSMGTFHDYNGDEAVLRGSQGSGPGWGRVFGEAIEQNHGGLLSPSFKGRAYGFQSGVDLWQSETPDGFRDRFGVFFSYARASGDVNGYALGIVNAAVGDVDLDSLGGGAYWTRMTPTDGYIEARFIGTHYSGDGTSSVNRQNISVNGKSFAGSLEAGQPFNFGNGIVIEPQAQVIYQYLDMNGRDPFATLNYDTPNALYARFGVRASSDSFLGLSNVRPYLKANIWQDVVGADKVAFSAADVVDTNFRATALEVGGGLVAQLTPSASVWGMVDYTTDIAGSQERQIIRGNGGFKLTW